MQVLFQMLWRKRQIVSNQHGDSDIQGVKMNNIWNLVKQLERKTLYTLSQHKSFRLDSVLDDRVVLICAVSELVGPKGG